MVCAVAQLSAMLTHLRARWGRSTSSKGGTTSSNSLSWCCRHCLYPQIHQSHTGSWAIRETLCPQSCPRTRGSSRTGAAGYQTSQNTPNSCCSCQVSPGLQLRARNGGSKQDGASLVSMRHSSHTCRTLSQQWSHRCSSHSWAAHSTHRAQEPSPNPAG